MTKATVRDLTVDELNTVGGGWGGGGNGSGAPPGGGLLPGASNLPLGGGTTGSPTHAPLQTPGGRH